MTSDDELEREPESWERLAELAGSGSKAELVDYLEGLGAGEVARAFSRLDEEGRRVVFASLTPEQAADFLEELPDEQAADLVDELPFQQAAAIVEELDSDDQADILGAMPEAEAEGILGKMDPTEAQEARHLLSYDPRCAGGIMVTEYLAFPGHWTVRDILNNLEKKANVYSNYDILYGYVVDSNERLLGILRFRDLLLSPRSKKISDIMLTDMVIARDRMELDGLEEIFDRHEFFAVPVVDEHDRLIGVVRRSDVREAVSERADQTFLQASGILGGEEFRNMPLRTRSVRRLSVLMVNVGLNIISASVIAAYQDTLAAVIALAVFLPIISDLSGCAGNQAIAVSIRELYLGLVKPHELFRVLIKELGVGILNGIMLGILLGFVAAIWKGNLFLGVVIGSAMSLNTLLAVGMGGTIPLVLKRLNIDPAIASSSILTTVTDVCGFFLVLSFATLALSHLA